MPVERQDRFDLGELGTFCFGIASQRRRQSRRTRRTSALRRFVARAATKPPTPLRDAEWGTLCADFWAWREETIEERSFVAKGAPQDDGQRRVCGVVKSYGRA